MIYALKLSDSAIAGLQSLPLWLQDETLDQIDTLTMGVKRPRKPDIRPLAHDFTREHDQETHYIFIRYRISTPPRQSTFELSVAT